MWRSCSASPLRSRGEDRGEGLVGLASPITLELLERFAQTRLVRVHHFAKGQTNFGRHRAAPIERGFHRHRIRFNEQIFEQREHFAVQTFRRFEIARFARAHERANFRRK